MSSRAQLTVAIATTTVTVLQHNPNMAQLVETCHTVVATLCPEVHPFQWDILVPTLLTLKLKTHHFQTFLGPCAVQKDSR